MTGTTPEYIRRPRRRRIARLVASFVAIAAGIFYVMFPPNTTTAFFDTSIPAVLWGSFFVIGGVLCALSWFYRVLPLDRIGLMFLIYGTGALSAGQTMVMLTFPITYTRGGGTFALYVLVCYLIARWQDVRADEKEALQAIEETGGVGGGLN